MVVQRQPTPVLHLECKDEVGAIRDAWERLEGEEPGDLAEGELPGGAYARERRRGEPPEVYDRIAGPAEALGPRDPSRRILEHYSRRDEIDILVPVNGR